MRINDLHIPQGEGRTPEIEGLETLNGRVPTDGNEGVETVSAYLT